MSRKEFVIVSQETVEVRTADGYMELAFSVFGGGFESDMRIIDNLEMVVNRLLDMLPEDRRLILKYNYGLCGYEVETQDNISSLLNIWNVERKMDGALRRMKNSRSMSDFLQGNQIIPDFSDFMSKEYKSNLLNLLWGEVSDIVNNTRNKSVYLKNIMNRNGITINLESNVYMDDTDIEDLEFSIRTYNCLRRHGVLTLGELRRMSYEELIKVRNLGRKSVDEIKRKLSEIEISNGYRTIVLNARGEKIIYKYLDGDSERITRSLYDEIFCIKKNIFSLSLSPGLSDLLLLKGYIYEEDIFANVDILEEQLRNFGFEDCAEELVSWKKYTEIDRLPAKPVYVCMPSDEVIGFVKQCPALTSEDLLKQARKKGMTEVIDIIQRVVKLDEDVDEDEEDLYVEFDDEDTDEIDDEIFIDDRMFLDE